MFQFTNKPSSGSHSQYLAKITGLVQCRYRRRTDVTAMVALLFFFFFFYSGPVSLSSGRTSALRLTVQP